MNALINCTLKASPEKSNTAALAGRQPIPVPPSG
jgi:hypothetical protein